MRDFLWRYFENTGDIEAYLLLREQEQLGEMIVQLSGEEEELQPFS